MDTADRLSDAKAANRITLTEQGGVRAATDIARELRMHTDKVGRWR